MDQETANILFKEGATLLLLDYPIGSEIGIDMQSWNTGEKFKGIKMIPPGNHFVYYSVANKEGQTAPRTGFFIHLNRKELAAKRWDASLEDFIDVIDSDEELERLKSNLEILDPFLGPYSYDTFKRWISLSNRITIEVIRKVEPLTKRITSVADLVPSKTFTQKHRHRDSKKSLSEDEPSLKAETECSDQPRTPRVAEDFLLPEMHYRPGTNLRFTEISSRRYPEGASSRDITMYSLDSTYVLEQLLKQWESPMLLLGELQLAFLSFLIGQSYLGFEQWKQLVYTIATSDQALSRIPGFFLEFLNDFYFQLSEVSEDFFVDIVTQNNFLVQTLHTMFTNIDECQDIGHADSESTLKLLKEKAAKLKDHLETRFKWDFGAEPEDEAPVVVENL